MKKTEGILVASDSHQEWLLEWWWEKYTKHNSYPVAFVDFGMSSKMALWCKEKGDLIPFSFEVAVSANEKIMTLAKNSYGDEITHTRSCWFKKPLATTLTPFDKTIWLDLDCEVLGPLDPLFTYKHVSLAKDIKEPNTYNSGVIVYKKNSPLIEKWAAASKNGSTNYVGDQNLLSFLIHSENIKIDELPEEYNWRMCQGININAQIIHWVGLWGKEIIKKFGGLPSI
ncbi:MAG: hypothetical protein FJZ59_02425 [Chlamydiae bacterium]|nr:hypothetical protein [Chlamydiota bacterium]